MITIPRKASRPEDVKRVAFSIAETAVMLGCSERSIRTWIKEGQLKSRKIGRRVFVPADALDEFLMAEPASENVEQINKIRKENSNEKVFFSKDDNR